MISARAYMPEFVKGWVWNFKWRRTSAQPKAPRDMVDFIARRIAPDDSILDLGCGPGNLLASLRAESWRGFYRGVDISRRSIESAERLMDGQASFEVASLESFTPRACAHAVLMESLYYVRLDKVESVLRKCLDSLRPGGKVFIRIHDDRKHAAYVSEIERLGAIRCGPRIWLL